ncbi:MAG: D-alanine--D-alanine ligase [Phycisphaeraceae bacterium]
MPRSHRILVLVHPDCVPPDSIEGLSNEDMAPFKTEFDVVATLKNMGHSVHVLGVSYDLSAIRVAVEEFKPYVVFNMLEEFAGVGVFDTHVAAYLEALRVPYTGCNPRGLMLAHNKGLAKMVCRYHRIPVPAFHVFPIGQRKATLPKRLAYPMIVKSLTEEGSVGISQASLVNDDAALQERVRFVHRSIGTDAIAERYIDGREIYVGVIGNQRLQTLPIWEMDFSGLPERAPRIATTKLKWDEDYQKKIKLNTGPAKGLPPGLEAKLPRLAKRAYRALQLSGYARMDFRVTDDGQVYLLEANPNPQLMYGEDFAESAENAGIDYEHLLTRIVSLGRRYRLIGQA